MFKKAWKKVVFIAILLYLQSVSVSAQGVMLINTDFIEGDDTYIFDGDDSGGDIKLQFGQALGEYLEWNDTDNAFKFSDDLDLENNQLLNARIENAAIAPTCDGTVPGKIYHDTADTNSYVCNGTSWVQIDGGGGAAVGDLATVQARNSAGFTLTAQNTWYDITFGNTDVETDASVIEHNNTNTERIDIKEDGVYMVTYAIDAVDNTTTHGLQVRIYINGTTELPGSLQEEINFQGEHGPASGTFIAEFNSGDYLTLQAQRLTVNTIVGEPTMTVTKLDGVVGPQGPAGTVGTGTDEDSWTIDEDFDGTDLDLQFGDTATAYLQWNETAQGFIFGDDLLLNFNELKQFKIENASSAPTCNSSYTGRAYHNTTDTFTYVCDGTSWKQIDTGASSLVIGQFYDGAGGTDINNATPTAIPFNSETREETGITHDTVTNNSRVYMDDPGWYQVSYNISSNNGGNGRINARCRVRLNGTTDIDQSNSYSYVRNSTDEWGTNTATTLIQTTSSNEYYEVYCNGEGSAGTSNAVANQSWTIVEKK